MSAYNSTLHISDKHIFDSSGKWVDSERSYFPFVPILRNGTEHLIADLTLDTLYSFKENKLTPIAVQHPSIRAQNPPLVISPFIYTDTYLIFKPVLACDEPSNPQKQTTPILVWNRKTGDIENWHIHNPNISKRTMYLGHFYRDNMYSTYTPAENVLLFYQHGVLGGRLKEVASKLNEEDNGVVTIFKYK